MASVCSCTREEIYTYSVKLKLILSSPWYLVVKYVYVYAFHHILSSISSPMHSCILLHAHAYRIAGGNNVVGIRGSGRRGPGGTIASSSRKRRAGLEELSECPNHRPTSFLKGKPRSILSLLSFYKYHLSPLCLMH